MADEQHEERQQETNPTPRLKLPRPESTIAQNFAADLDSMFGLSSDPAVEDLSRTVEEKKHTVTTGERELLELEARLRDTEQRLARVSRQNSPSRPADTVAPGKVAADGAAKPSPLAQKPTYPDSRPATADRPPPGRADVHNGVQHHQNGNNEYVMVDRSDGSAQRGYG